MNYQLEEVSLVIREVTVDLRRPWWHRLYMKCKRILKQC